MRHCNDCLLKHKQMLLQAESLKLKRQLYSPKVNINSEKRDSVYAMNNNSSRKRYKIIKIVVLRFGHHVHFQHLVGKNLFYCIYFCFFFIFF